MTKLLSDIEVSRSAPVAAFLELETAARSGKYYLMCQSWTLFMRSYVSYFFNLSMSN